MKLRILVAVFFLLILLQNCRTDKHIPGICFEENILPIFIGNCVSSGCHSGENPASGYDFTNYKDIMKAVVPGHPGRSKLYLSIRGNNPAMPPEGSHKLSSKEVDYIKSWIQFGANNSANCNTCDTSSFGYSADIVPLLNIWCVNCHTASNPGGGVVLTDYAGISLAAANGKLLGSMNHELGYVPMPQYSEKLSSCKIALVKKWIDSGFPEN